MSNLHEFLEEVTNALPPIVSDKDLVEMMPKLFKSRTNLSRLRAKNLAPNFFKIPPKTFCYLKEDVIAWIKAHYSGRVHE